MEKRLVRTHRLGIWFLVLVYIVIIWVGGWHWRTDFLFLMVLIYGAAQYGVLCLHAWFLDSPSPWREGLRRYHTGMTFYESRAEVAEYSRRLEAEVSVQKAKDRLVKTLRTAAGQYPSISERVQALINGNELNAAAELVKQHQEQLRAEDEKDRRAVEIRKSALLAEAEKLGIRAEVERRIDADPLNDVAAFIEERKREQRLALAAERQREAVTQRHAALMTKANALGLHDSVRQFENDGDETKLESAIRNEEERRSLIERTAGVANRINGLPEPSRSQLRLELSPVAALDNRELRKALHALERAIEEAEQVKSAKRRGG